MRYKDNKWLIIKNKKRTEIFCVCPCGFTHDIAFDSKGKLEGTGTCFARTKWGKKMAQQCPQEIKIYGDMLEKSLAENICKGIDLPKKLREEAKKNPTITIDKFYDKYKVPKKARTDFGTAALISQAFKKEKKND